MSNFIKQAVALSATALVGLALVAGAVGPASSAPKAPVAHAARLVA